MSLKVLKKQYQDIVASLLYQASENGCETRLYKEQDILVISQSIRCRNMSELDGAISILAKLTLDLLPVIIRNYCHINNYELTVSENSANGNLIIQIQLPEIREPDPELDRPEIVHDEELRSGELISQI